MILDINAILSSAQALTVTAVSSNVYDVAGLGVGVAVTNAFGLQNTSFGDDLGGGGPTSASSAQVLAVVGTWVPWRYRLRPLRTGALQQSDASRC